MLVETLQVVAGTVAAGLIGKAANAVGSPIARELGKADKTLLRVGVGPLLPLAALAGAGAVGVVLAPDDVQAIAQSPLMAIGSIALREALRKWVIPGVGKLFPK